MRFRIAVVAFGEISIERSDDRVGFIIRAAAVARPLADAGAAGVREDLSADGLEVGEDPVALDGRADQCRTGGDCELGRGFYVLLLGLTSQRCAAGHVFVGRMGERNEEAHLDCLRLTDEK